MNWTSMTSWLDGMFLSRGVGRELGLWWCFTAKGKILMEEDEILLGDASASSIKPRLQNPAHHTPHLPWRRRPSGPGKDDREGTSDFLY